jgi:hypothetical protein
MGLLKLVDDKIDIDYYEYRDHYFYKKYKYRLRLYVTYLRYLFSCKSVNELEKKISRSWDCYGRYSKSEIEAIKNSLPALSYILEFIIDASKDKSIAIRSEDKTIAIFGNDLESLHDFIDNIEYYYSYDITEAKVGESLDTKYFMKKPKYKYRVYLRDRKVSSEFVDSLRETLKKNKTSMFPSGSLNNWLNPLDKKYIYRQKYCSSTYFINYNDESFLSYLLLMHGDNIGKRYKLEKRQDTE